MVGGAWYYINPFPAEPDISSLKKSVDSDQLASVKSADQDPHCFPF